MEEKVAEKPVQRRRLQQSQSTVSPQRWSRLPTAVMYSSRYPDRPRTMYVPYPVRRSPSKTSQQHTPYYSIPKRQWSDVPLLEREIRCPTMPQFNQTIREWSRKWFTHVGLIALLIAYLFLGAGVFQKLETGKETEIKQKQLDLQILANETRANFSQMLLTNMSDYMWDVAVNMNVLHEEDFKARVQDYAEQIDEQIQQMAKIILDAGTAEINMEESRWTLLEALFFSATVITSIGYGHIVPVTTEGKIFCMCYAIFGMPILLIVLADIGKLFTRAIKFVWSYARRFYYTGQCRAARHALEEQADNIMGTAQKGVDFVKSGAETAADTVTGRKKSVDTITEKSEEEEKEEESKKEKSPSQGKDQGDSPNAVGDKTEEDDVESIMPEFVVDDEFNLPVSVALILLVSFMFIGAVIFSAIEGWPFLDGFYYCFISLSTIGFGDFVPDRLGFMMAASVYVFVGLSLTSMVINVVMEYFTVKIEEATEFMKETLRLTSEYDEEKDDDAAGKGDDDDDDEKKDGNEKSAKNKEDAEKEEKERKDNKKEHEGQNKEHKQTDNLEKQKADLRDE